MPRGYDRALYILPFDHRGSFQTNMFGWKSPLSEAQTRLAEQKGDARANGRRDRQAAITTLSICLSGQVICLLNSQSTPARDITPQRRPDACS
jgi:hypothetical protein